MINLLMALAILAILVIVNRKLFNYPSWNLLALYLILGAGSGLLLDYLFGYHLGLWWYTHHEWYAPDYWLFLIPAWAMTLTIYVLAWHLISNKIKIPWLAFLVYCIIVPCEGEAINFLWRHSWGYQAPLPLLIIGWVILLGTIAGSKWLVEGREVKVKDESLSLG